MLIKGRSRQADWRRELKRDPNPRLKRFDGYISKSAADMLVAVQDSMNMTKRDALEYCVECVFVHQTLRGKIRQSLLSEICWARAAEAERVWQRKHGTEGEAAPAKEEVECDADGA